MKGPLGVVHSGVMSAGCLVVKEPSGCSMGCIQNLSFKPSPFLITIVLPPPTPLLPLSSTKPSYQATNQATMSDSLPSSRKFGRSFTKRPKLTGGKTRYRGKNGRFRQVVHKKDKLEDRKDRKQKTMGHKARRAAPTLGSKAVEPVIAWTGTRPWMFCPVPRCGDKDAPLHLCSTSCSEIGWGNCCYGERHGSACDQLFFE